LITHDKKVSMFIMYVLTIYLIQTQMRVGKWGERAQMSVNGGHTKAKWANNQAGVNKHE
jgi:hypothetical protein